MSRMQSIANLSFRFRAMSVKEAGRKGAGLVHAAAIHVDLNDMTKPVPRGKTGSVSQTTVKGVAKVAQQVEALGLTLSWSGKECGACKSKEKDADPVHMTKCNEYKPMGWLYAPIIRKGRLENSGEECLYCGRVYVGMYTHKKITWKDLM